MSADDPEFQRWNTRFTAPNYVFGTEPNAFLASQKNRLKPGQMALVPADGEGRNGVWLARQGLDVTSLDFSPAAQEKARALAKRFDVALRTELVDLHHWRWQPERYDVVVAIMIQISRSPEREAVFAGMISTLKRGGFLLMQGYRPEQLRYKTGGPPTEENMYTEDMLRRAFGAMTIHNLRAHDDPIAEGAGHAGMSALIDMVAEKR